MPNWKKVIVSGSNAALNNITSSGNISASGTGQFGNSVTVTGTDAILNLYEGGTLQTSLHSRGNTNSFIEAGAGNSSNLGIGTQSPPEKLTVAGNISASGTIIAATLDAAAVSDTLAAAVVAEIDNDEIPIAKLAEDAVTVTAGTNLSNGGTVTLGGSITLNVDDAFLKNDADDTTSGTITSAGLIATKATDGGDTVIQIINSNTDGGEDKGAGIEFKHGSALGALSGNQRAGKILATKASGYQGSTTTIDSNLEFYTANNDTDILQLKIDNTGLAEFTGNISASGTSTGSFGRVEANSFSKQICVTNHGFALDSNNSEPNYFPLNNLNETRVGDTAQYYARMIAPYDGKVVKVMVRADADIGNSCSVVLTKLSTSGQNPDGLRDEGTDVETVSGIDCSTLNTTYTFAFSNGAFSTGDVVNVGLQKNSTNTANVTAVVVWEYTL